MRMLHHLAMTLSLLALAGAPLRAGVTVVDPAGAPGAALLQAALDAAQPGDILLLKAGDYTGQLLHVQDTAVALIAEAGADVVLSALRFESTDGAPVVLRGLRLVGLPEYSVNLEIDGDTDIWIEDCSSTPPDAGGFGISGAGAMSVNNEGSRVLVRCVLQGGDGADATTSPAVPAQIGGNALQLPFAGIAAVMEVTATGGAGGDGPDETIFLQNGGHGLQSIFLDGLWILGGTFTGGDEGDGNLASSQPGSGLNAGFTNTLAIRDATFVAGNVHGAGTPVLPAVLGAFNLYEFPASARSFEVASPARELQAAPWSVRGEPGDQGFVFVAAEFDLSLVTGKQGMFLLGLETDVFSRALGTLGASGVLTGQFVMPRLPPGLDGVLLYTQVGVMSAKGEPLFGSGSALAWIDSTL
jgi:hypothetical protein